MSRLSRLAAAILAGAFTLPSIAATRHVTYADLDLTTAADRAVMDNRIRAAAFQLCVRGNSALSQTAACTRESVAQARAELHDKLAASTVRLATR